MKKLSHQIHSFDEFTLDLTRGCLLRSGEDIKLRPKAFEVLSYLVRNNGRLISKDELIHSVWVDTAVTDGSLVQCLIEVRRALGDEAQQIIKTVPRRGYIFDRPVSDNGATWQMTTYTADTAAVQVIIEEEADGREPNEIAAATPQLPAAGKESVARRFTGAIWRHKTVTAIALAIVVVAVLGLARPFLAWWFKPPSIAILRIVNATGDPNNDYISDGLTESLIRSLVQINEPGKFPRLLVTAQNTVFAFNGREPRGIGRELGVDTVLASQMTEQNGLRFFKVEMINVANGSEVWSKQYSSVTNRHGAEFPELQDNIARELAEKLPLKLSSEEQQRLTRRYTQNPEAYDYFLKSRASFFKTTPTGFRKSIEYGQQAIDLDPNFALAYWSMGLSYSLRGVIGDMPMKEANDKAIELSVKALKIDNTLRAAQGSLQLAELAAWDWEAIEKAGQRHAGYSFSNGYLIAMGRLDEQLALENRRLALDPQSPGSNFFHATTLFLARQYDAAIQQYQKTLNIGSVEGKPYLGPESPWIHLGLGQVYVQKGMFREAFVELNKGRELVEDLPIAWEGLGYAYAKAGQKEEALKIIDQLQARSNKGEYVLPLGVAWIYIGLGDKDQAFGWLEKAFAERSDGMRQIKTNPIYDPLRSDPRFTDLLRRVRLPT